MLCLPVNAYCSRSICVLFIFIIESPFLLYYLILFILFLFQFFRVANQIRIIHMGRSQRWDCLVVWFCYQLMARLDGRMVAPSWPGPCEISQNLVIIPTKWILIYVCIKFYTNQYVCVYYFILHHTYVWYKSFCFLPEASFGLWVLSLPASVCVYVCVCGNHLLVCTSVCAVITCHPFKLVTPNLDQKSKTPWLRSLLFLGLIDLELPGQIQLQSKKYFELVHAIIHHLSKIRFPNFDE